jgi:DNA-binding transcriptional ArsR family regulator
MTAPDPMMIDAHDSARIRAIAHPARLAILSHLRDERQATATELAGVVGLSPSATSYHLRALARAGLIQDADTRGDGRERVWRGLASGLHVEGGHAETPEEKAAEQALWSSMMAWQEARTLRYLNSYYDLPVDLQEIGTLVETVTEVTVAESQQLLNSFRELLKPYEKAQRPNPPEGAQRVSFILRIIPTDI